MEELKQFLLGPGKRIIAAMVGVVCVAMNKKWGLEISEAGQAEITAILSLFIAQSKWGEVQHAKLSAANEDVEVPQGGKSDTLKVGVGLLLLCFLPLMGCQTVSPIVVTGRSLDEVSTQFSIVSEVMREQVDKGGVTPEQFRDWAKFSDKFTLFYAQAVVTWHSAREIGDDFTAKNLSKALQDMGLELLGWYNTLNSAGLIPRVMP